MIVVPAVCLYALAGCGDDEPTGPTAQLVFDDEIPNGDDLIVIDKVVSGIEYRCLYIYVDGIEGGGPAMWCHILNEQGEN